ncbi:retention module-containing protein [Aeromonas media]|uniref:Retention module-containing protein n=1 Tax=Aeromonas media TaxID=651 RepID=A0AAW5RQW8_AERME|nr:retention module-containing protein [Aeromonas media]MCV3290131.1 retention module-containing protein [Aeromonas media]
MAELRIEKPTLVTQVEGAVFVMDADGTLRRATPGMQLEPGMRLLTESDGRFELAEPAGEAPDASQPEQGGVGPAGAMNPELATLQEAIRQGADPTELFEETAAGDAAAGTAGGVVGSSAGGFVVVDRINDATLAEAGFDTDHQGALPGDELLYSEDQGLLAAITITEPQTADNIINGDEATGVIIRGVVEDVEVGQTVTVTLLDQEGNRLTTTTVVLPGFVWEANFGDVTGKLVDGPLSIQADTQDAAGNRASDTLTVTVDTRAAIDIDDLDTSSILGRDNVTLSGSTSEVEAGQRVTITLIDQSGQTLHSGSALVGSDGRWQLSGLDLSGIEGPYEVRAEVTDLAGNRVIDGAPLIGQSDVLTLSEADLAKGPVSASGSLHTGAGMDGNLQVSLGTDQSALEHRAGSHFVNEI